MDQKPSFSTDFMAIMVLSPTKIQFLSQIWLENSVSPLYANRLQLELIMQFI